MNERNLHGVVLAIGIVLVFAIQASATPITFYGLDNGVGPGGARPNSDAAAASFALATGPTSLINFESAPVGDFATLGLGGGVSVALVNRDPTGSGILNAGGDAT